MQSGNPDKSLCKRPCAQIEVMGYTMGRSQQFKLNNRKVVTQDYTTAAKQNMKRETLNVIFIARTDWLSCTSDCLRKVTTANKWLSQALHCQSYGMLVNRSISTDRYIWFTIKDTQLIASVQSPQRIICAHVQLNVIKTLFQILAYETLFSQ